MRYEKEAGTNGPRFSLQPEGERTLLGRTISHYRILDKLGGGNMGVVYRAEDIMLKRTVALKFLPPDLTREPDARRRFLREARAASTLDHPNACTIHEIAESEDDQIFMAMSCYEGETLKGKIQRGPLGAEEVRKIGIHVTRGLANAHDAGIIHRDIKPANIFITNDGLAKILDFGIAKLVNMGSVTLNKEFIGTVHYMSPEQINGTTVDLRSDIWSFGVLMYEMITGRLPFAGHYPSAVIYSILNEEPPEPRTILNDIPEYLERMMMRCLQKNPADRYENATAIEDELANPSWNSARSLDLVA